EEQRADEELEQKIDQEIPGGDEIGERQNGAGVVVCGEQDLGLLRVPRHHVTAVQEAASLHLGRVAGPPQLVAQPSAEARLLLLRLADLKVRQELFRHRRHSRLPRFMMVWKLRVLLS